MNKDNTTILIIIISCLAMFLFLDNLKNKMEWSCEKYGNGWRLHSIDLHTCINENGDIKGIK